MGISSNDNARVRAGRSAAIAAVLAAAAALALPAAGQAAFQTFGSDLSAPADVTQARQADTAYWQKAFAGGADPTVPVAGQVKEVRIKGYAKSDRPPGALGGGGETGFHVQALESLPDGAVRPRITSQFFDLPNAAAGDAQTVTSFRPENFCVKPGDRIAFNTIGGWDGVMNRTGPYPDGTPLQIFASVPGAATSEFTGDNQTNNGAAFHADPAKGHAQELLMQVVLATGDDRSYECGGPNTYRPADPVSAPNAPVAQKTTIPEKQRVNVSKKGIAGLALFCQAGSAACAGKVTIYATSAAKRTVAIGAKSFSIRAKSTGKLQIKLSKAGFRLWKKRGRKLPVTIVAVTNPGTPDHQHSFKVTMKKVGAR